MGGFGGSIAALLNQAQPQAPQSDVPAQPNLPPPGAVDAHDFNPSTKNFDRPSQTPVDQYQQLTNQFAQQNIQQNQPTGHGLKASLQRMAYGFGQAAMKESGLPTDDELQNSAVQRAHLQAQTQLVQQQIQQLQPQPLSPQMAGMIGVPPGTRMSARDFSTSMALGLRGDNAIAAIKQRQQGTLAASALKTGYRMNPDGQPEAIPYDQLSEQDKSKIDLNQATEAYKQAQATGEPQKVKLALDKLNATIQHQQAMEGIGKMNAASNAMRAGRMGGASQNAGEIPNMKQLSPMAQKTIQETLPVHNQIRDLLGQFESMKEDNTPAKFFADRAKYAAGIQSDIGTASDAIAQLELNRVVGAARVLKGSSRAIQAMQMAMKHLPNVWIDSPKLIYSKLSNLDKALGQIEDSAYDNGNKNGMTANPRTNTGSDSAPTIGQIKKFPNGNVGKWDGKGYVLQGSN